MAEFTYLPGPGDYTIMILDRGSSFALIDWEHIGWEEAVRRVNLFCASPSILALLEKALPIIELEAEYREAFPTSKESDNPYWSEMRDLANEISAEIDRARGKPIPESKLCPHGFGFVEYCPDCKKGKETSHG